MKLNRSRGLAWALLTVVPLGCSGVNTTTHGDASGGVAGSASGIASGGSPPAPTIPPDSGGTSPWSGGANSDPTTDTAGGGGAPTSHGIPVCESPTFDVNSQLVSCANGFAHRAHPPDCGSGPNAGGGAAGAAGGPSTTGAPGLEFAYGAPCNDDSDCLAGTACVCGASAYFPASVVGGGGCVLATCRTDADCGAGSYCAVGDLNFFGDALPGFGCLRADDECTIDADCNASDGEICLEEAKRTCSLPPS